MNISPGGYYKSSTAVLRDPSLTIGIGQFAAIQSVAPALGLEVTEINLRNASDIERAVTAFAGSPMAASSWRRARWHWPIVN